MTRMQSWRAHVAALFEAAGTSSPKGVSAAGSKLNVVRRSFIEHRDHPRGLRRYAIVAHQIFGQNSLCRSAPST